jgi:hypothetical protein
VPLVNRDCQRRKDDELFIVRIINVENVHWRFFLNGLWQSNHLHHLIPPMVNHLDRRSFVFASGKGKGFFARQFLKGFIVN